MKHKMESRFLGEITITSDMQMTQPLCRKRRETKEPLLNVKEESEKVGLKVNIHKTEIMASGPIQFSSVQFSSVQSLSRVRLFATPWITACQASLSINSRSSLRLASIESMMPSSHLILCCPLLLLPSIPLSISLFQWVNSSHEVAKVLEFQL